VTSVAGAAWDAFSSVSLSRTGSSACHAGASPGRVGRVGHRPLVEPSHARGARQHANPDFFEWSTRPGQRRIKPYAAHGARGLSGQPLLARIERGEIDPTRIITHTLPLDQAPHGYDIFKNKDVFKNKQDNCEKAVLEP
jgi:threonine dehydrogenase-like Zn-dependent dehydrogenase